MTGNRGEPLAEGPLGTGPLTAEQLAAADRALAQIEGHLQRMRGLALIATHEALCQEDRALIQEEIGQICGEIDAIAERSGFC